MIHYSPIMHMRSVMKMVGKGSILSGLEGGIMEMIREADYS